MERQYFLLRHHHSQRSVRRRLCLLLGCVLCLVNCSPGGNTGTPPADLDAADRQFMRQGATEVLNLYRTALVQEDIDRLQALLQPVEARVQSEALRPQRPEEAAFADGQTFREVMTE